jgi:splicing factor 3A subunit 3
VIFGFPSLNVLILGGKQFAKATVFKAHLDGKKHKRAVDLLQGGGESSSKSSDIGPSVREYMLKEALISKLAEILSPQREDTRAHVERKQSLTFKERVSFTLFTLF